MAGARGMRFDSFPSRQYVKTKAAMYAHLQQGEQPEWWLQPVLT